MAIFRPISMADAAILDFEIFEILTVGTLTRAKLHHRAKFRGDPSSRCCDFAIFRFFKTAIAAILDFQNLGILGVGRVK